MDVVKNQSPMDIHELIAYINHYSNSSMDTEHGHVEGITFLGDGVPIYEDIIWKEIKVPCKMAPASHNRQRGASVAVYGAMLFKEGKYVDADDLAPEYLRKSQAERVSEEKSRSGQYGSSKG